MLLRQRAELIVQVEAVLPEEMKSDPELFPTWLCWYQPAEKEVEALIENGVINGITQKLGDQTKEIHERIDQIENAQKQVAKDVNIANERLEQLRRLLKYSMEEVLGGLRGEQLPGAGAMAEADTEDY